MTSHSNRPSTGLRAPVRLATAADIPQLFDVRTSVRENHLDMKQLADRGVTPESMAGQIASDDSRTWVVEHDGTVAGFSMADAQTGSISAIFVAPGMEGRGYGRALLEVAEEWLFAQGWKTIWLQTGEEPHNRSHGFYRAAGWAMTAPADHGDVRYEKSRVG